MEPLVLESTEHGVTRLTFNRPAQRNAMSVDMMELFVEKFTRAAADPSVRCIVLDGAGGNFVAGGDIKSWSRLIGMSPAERSADFVTRMAGSDEVMLRIDAVDKPIITAVRGHAAGAGLSFVLVADFVVAEENAQFHFANIRAALVPDFGITYFLPRVVGERQAMRLSLLGSQIGAAQGQALGLVTDLVPSGDFDAKVAELAAKLAAGPVTAAAKTKKLLRAARHATLGQQLKAEIDGVVTCAADEDFLEAVSAFASRRPPQFGRQG
jgi:2-(1,2-epoxy-1,2-dihydrophenyl)acetyl-CoA isomerase